MKNKGYTLIELLAVIIILACLITLVFPSIINFIKSSNEKKDNITRDLVYNAAEMFIEDNASEYYSNEGSKYCISINTLIENNYLKGDLEYQGEELDNTKSVKVTYTDKFNYEIMDLIECNRVCKLVSDSDASNSITVGDKYQCKVKEEMEEDFEDGYYFYVLSKNDDGTTNFIMDRNLGSTVAFGYTYEGPTIALTYLNNQTSQWNNIDLISDYTYQNGGIGYNKIRIQNGITTLEGEATVTIEGKTRARLLTPGEIDSKEIGCTSNEAGCPKWLYGNLSSSSNNNQPECYWTPSTNLTRDYFAFSIYYDGWDYHISNVEHSDSCGIRPVITVPNSLISK